MSEAGGGDPDTPQRQGPSPDDDGGDDGGADDTTSDADDTTAGDDSFFGSDEERWGLVLVLLLVGYLTGTLVHHPSVRFVLNTLVVAMVLLAVYRGDLVPRALRLVSSAGVAAVVGLTAVNELTSSPVLRGVEALAAAMVFATVLFAILIHLLRIRLVTLSTVFGAIDAYVLIGFTFAWIYVALYEFKGTFFAQGGPSTVGDFLYFSLITLTTVGFGDLTPGTQVARSLVAIEAVLGQVMLVTLVARLVSLMGQVREPPKTLPRPTIRRRNRPADATDQPPADDA